MAEISRQMIGKLLEHTYLYDPCSVSPKTFQAKEVYLVTFRRVQYMLHIQCQYCNTRLPHSQTHEFGSAKQ